MADCCEGEKRTPRELRDDLCPVCGAGGRAVETITLKALLRPGGLARLRPSRHHLCPDSGCPVVYFAPGSIYEKDDLKVRVGFKETNDPILVCYCFGHTRESIAEEIRRTGSSTAPASIAAHVKAGQCGCEVNNPSGSCCLGEVNREVKAARDHMTAVHVPDTSRK